MELSIIIPCLNEQDSLPVLYRKCISVLKDCVESFEMIFIDDGSTDDTLRICRKMATEDPRIRYCSFSRNFGKEAAIYAGLQMATGDYVAVMDADLQDPPELLKEMIRLLREGENGYQYDIVAARRSDRKGESRIRSWFSRLFYKIIRRISDSDITDGARDFRMMTRRVVEAVLSVREYNRFSKGIFGWIGFRTKWLSYENAERVAGKTKWSFGKLFHYAVDGIVSFSNVPLSIASWSGVLMTVISFLILVIVILRKVIFGDPVTGWASTVCIILFIGGIQLFCMGIIGQYLAKTYMEVKRRPLFIVAESSKKEKTEEGKQTDHGEMSI